MTKIKSRECHKNGSTVTHLRSSLNGKTTRAGIENKFVVTSPELRLIITFVIAWALNALLGAA